MMRFLTIFLLFISLLSLNCYSLTFFKLHDETDKSVQLRPWQKSRFALSEVKSYSGVAGGTLSGGNKYIWILSGFDGGSGVRTTVEKASIVGELNIPFSFSTTTEVPTGLSTPSALLYEDFIYYGGGFTTGGYTNLMWSGPVASDGTVDSWTSINSLDVPRAYYGLYAHNDYLYAVGGENNSDWLDTVYYASINGDGTIGAWTATTSLNTRRSSFLGTTYTRKDGVTVIYALGGFNGSSPLTGEMGIINSSTGEIDSWTEFEIPFNVQETGMCIINDVAYLIGPVVTSGGFATTENILYSKINTDGTFQEWRTLDEVFAGGTRSFVSNGPTSTVVIGNTCFVPVPEISNGVESNELWFTFPFSEEYK